MSRMRDGRNVPGPGDYYGNPPEEKFCHCYDQRKDRELLEDE